MIDYSKGGSFKLEPIPANQMLEPIWLFNKAISKYVLD